MIRSNSATEATGSAPRHGAPMTVLFGSNTGSSEAFARRIADDAQRRGWTVKLSSMDDAVGELGTEGALVVVTASYNGLPPDNAGRFCTWLDELAPEALAGLRYAVFGCGHRDWTTTFQAVPARVDAALAKAGAKAIVERGAADGRGDFFGDFDAWMPTLVRAADEALNVTSTAAAAQPLYTVEALAQRAVSRADAEGFVSASVLESVELVDLRAPRARSKKHIVLALPEGLSWQCGDYLAVMAENPQALVDRALARFSIEPDALLRLSSERASAATLPVGRAITARELLSSWVELAQPATKKQVELLASLTRCPPERAALDAYAKDYAETVLVPRRSALDLLEESPACALTFAGFLELLAPMKPRLYSIASSPKVDPARAALTVAVLDVPAYSGRGRHQGIASTHLARLRVGERVHVSLRSPNTPFRPAAPATPMLMIAAGTGIAPFRGFLEERAAQQAAGERVAKSVLYFGCDHPDVDLLYRDELRALEARGLLELRATYCEAPEGARVYVQHRITEEAADVKAMIDAGATVYLCGDGAKMAPAVREALATALGSREALAQLEREGRFVADVFS